MGFTDDPVRDMERYMEEGEAWLRSRPVCSCCEEHIQEDSYYDINDLIICEECLDSFRRFTE